MQKINEEKLDKRKSDLYTYIVEERRFLTAIFHHRHHAREQLKIHAHYLILPSCLEHACCSNVVRVHQEYQKQ